MSRQPKETADHATIMEWARVRNARPAVVTDDDGKATEMLRLNFPGYSGDELQEISWDDWLQLFEENNLKLRYREKTESGSKSNFNRIVDREA